MGRFCNQFKEAFPKQENYTEITWMVIKQQKLDNETYMEYHYDKMALLTEMGCDGQQAIHCLADGITDPFVQSQEGSGVYSTPVALLGYLSCLPGTHRNQGLISLLKGIT